MAMGLELPTEVLWANNEYTTEDNDFSSPLNLSVVNNSAGNVKALWSLSASMSDY